MKNFYELICKTASKRNNHTAFRTILSADQTDEKSFVNLRDDSSAFSNSLINLGLNNKHIAIIGENSYEWIVSFLGVVNSDNVIVPIDIRLDEKKIEELVKQADVEMIIYDKVFYEMVSKIKSKNPNIRWVVELSGNKCFESPSFKDLIKGQKEIQRPIDEEKCCMIMFTSGTSGISKGVMLNQKALLQNALICSKRAGFDSNMHILNVLPFYHICIVVDVLWTICGGGSLTFNNGLGNLFENTRRFKITKIGVVPMIVEHIFKSLKLYQQEYPDKSKVECKNRLLGENFIGLSISGAYLTPETRKELELFGVRVREGYGMTELASVLCTQDGCDYKEGSLGTVISPMEVKIADEEILVRGDCLMLGYYKDEKNTSDTIVDGWLRTGDLGHVDEDGYIFIKGRKKFLIITNNGENISPEELEKQILTESIIKEVLVYQEQDRTVAEVYTESGTEVYDKVKAVIDRVNGTNPMFKHIQKVKLRNTEFAKTPSMKIKRENYIFDN